MILSSCGILNWIQMHHHLEFSKKDTGLGIPSRSKDRQSQVASKTRLLHDFYFKNGYIT